MIHEFYEELDFRTHLYCMQPLYVEPHGAGAQRSAWVSPPIRRTPAAPTACVRLDRAGERQLTGKSK